MTCGEALAVNDKGQLPFVDRQRHGSAVRYGPRQVQRKVQIRFQRHESPVGIGVPQWNIGVASVSGSAPSHPFEGFGFRSDRRGDLTSAWGRVSNIDGSTAIDSGSHTVLACSGSKTNVSPIAPHDSIESESAQMEQARKSFRIASERTCDVAGANIRNAIANSRRRIAPGPLTGHRLEISTFRHCRRKVTDEKGNAGQRAPAGREPHRRC